MITPSFGLTATERVLPKLALDFTTASLDPRVTFTRTGNTATVVNSSGFVEPINADLPRFDFDPITLACKGLLIEETRINYLFPSEDISGFNYVNATFSSNQETAPDNVPLSADKLILNGGYMRVYVFGITSDATTVFSGFFKPAGVTQIRIEHIGSVGSSGRRVDFNLSTGQVIAQSSIGSPGGSTGFAEIIPYPNGWYKLVVGADPASVGNTFRQVFVYGLNYTGDGVIGVYTWGLQVELGAFATSYIPTAALAVTRNADVATMTGTNFSDWYNAVEGSFFVQATPTTNVSEQRILLDVAANSTNRMSLIQHTSSSLANYFVFVSGGVQVNLFTACTVGNIKSCFAYKQDNFAFDTDVGALVTDTLGSVLSPTFMKIGARQDDVLFINGHMQKISYWSQRLINNEIQSFSRG